MAYLLSGCKLSSLSSLLSTQLTKAMHDRPHYTDYTDHSSVGLSLALGLSYLPS